MQEKIIPAFIVLIAAAITSAINLINKVDVLTGLKRLLLVIIVFYIVGIIAKAVLKKALKKKHMDVLEEDLEKENDIEE